MWGVRREAQQLRAGRWIGVQDKPGPPIKFQDSQGYSYTEKACLE
ncbi:rCG21262, partial [Rattus norvegicus]